MLTLANHNSYGCIWLQHIYVASRQFARVAVKCEILQQITDGGVVSSEVRTVSCLPSAQPSDQINLKVLDQIQLISDFLHEMFLCIRLEDQTTAAEKCSYVLKLLPSKSPGNQSD